MVGVRKREHSRVVGMRDEEKDDGALYCTTNRPPKTLYMIDQLDLKYSLASKHSAAV
jgi:hypothetical protein